MPRPAALPVAAQPQPAAPAPPVRSSPPPSPYPHGLWFEWLKDEIQDPYFVQLTARVQEAAQVRPVYPPLADRYAALKMSPLDVKVVILGQDPYHNDGQAHGLSFSVRPGVRVPPSLANIYKEIENEGYAPAAGRDGCLQAWADQGVLLLNNVLSVWAHQPGSHRNWGWERFTDAIVQQLNTRRTGLVFVLWGRDASSKAPSLDASRHLVLQSPHPSPYSANGGFFGNQHFRRTNEWLEQQGQAPIVW